MHDISRKFWISYCFGNLVSWGKKNLKYEDLYAICLNILGIIVCPAFMLSFIPAFIDPHQEYFVNAGITKLSILWPATSRLCISGRYLLISITTIIATNYFFITYWLHVGLWNVSLSSIFSIMKNIDLLFNLKKKC